MGEEVLEAEGERMSSPEGGGQVSGQGKEM